MMKQTGKEKTMSREITIHTGTYPNQIRLSLIGAILLAPSVGAQPASFRGLGHIANSDRLGSTASALSADGSAVVGTAWYSPDLTMAFRWTAATGLTGLGFPPGGVESWASAVSADGSIVV